MKYKMWLPIMLVICILAGCSFSFGGTTEQVEEEEKETLGLVPDFSYEVIEQTPNILVNQIGYTEKNNKVAILQGNHLKNVFYVHHAQTHKKVYEGMLKTENLNLEEGIVQEGNGTQEVQKQIYLADFSKVQSPGTYYLYHPDLGYSYEFTIKEDVYDELEREVLSFIGEEKEDTSLICYQLTGLLLTKELYPSKINEMESFHAVCSKKAEYLMQAQDPVTGNVYTDISKAGSMNTLNETEKQQYISLAATAEFAGTLAMYAFQMMGEDENLAYRYQAAAQKAYLAIQNSLDNVGYDAGYFAATQLYRLTGRSKYAQAIGQYLAMKEEQKSYTEYDFSMFGDYAYLTLRSGSDLEWSEMIMKKIMKQAENISLSTGKNSYYVSGKREYNDIDGKLRDMSVLALVNYIITNHEYSMLQKNYLDYFLGRNPYNVCFMDGFGIRNAIETEAKIDAVNSSLFYLLLQSTKMQ